MNTEIPLMIAKNPQYAPKRTGAILINGHTRIRKIPKLLYVMLSIKYKNRVLAKKLFGLSLSAFHMISPQMDGDHARVLLQLKKILFEIIELNAYVV